MSTIDNVQHGMGNMWCPERQKSHTILVSEKFPVYIQIHFCAVTLVEVGHLHNVRSPWYVITIEDVYTAVCSSGLFPIAKR